MRKSPPTTGTPGGGSGQTNDEKVIGLIEDYLDDLVTQTPLVLRFTAAAIAAYHGVKTPYISWGLQRYRLAQGGRIKAEARYSVGTYNRGRASEWFIFTWPGMIPTHAVLGGEMLVIHEIHSVVKEEVRPMLKNIDVQYTIAVKRNKKVNRGTLAPLAGKLDGYTAMLLRFREDIQKIRPVALRSVAKREIGVLTKAINDVAAAKLRVSALTNGQPPHP